MGAGKALAGTERGGLAPLRDFVIGLDALLAGPRQGDWWDDAQQLLARLVAEDDWLPDSHARPDPVRYRQYLLHGDPAGRFSVVSFVWGPGQRTPIHDHTVWGMVGMLRGAELVEGFERGVSGMAPIGRRRLEPGDIDRFAPETGDIHRVSNAYGDRTSISIHVYGANIGEVQRSVFAEDGSSKPFVSGYAEAPPLDLWEGRAA